MKSFFSWLKRIFSRIFGRKKARGGNAKRFALSIGVEQSRRFGACPGAKRDSLQMKKLLKDNCEWYEYLSDSSATKQAVKATMSMLIDKVPEDGIFILTYSGHGGSQRFADTKDEADGKDEYLCLYDTYLKDDDIWDMVTKCKGKVFLFFDCCHSETMFRAPLIPPEDLLREPDPDLCGAGARDAVITTSPVDMLVWSGCPDNTYSYGDNAGGLFTNALLDALNHGKRTYSQVWAHIKSDRSLSQYAQKPQQTILGKFDVNMELWS